MRSTPAAADHHHPTVDLNAFGLFNHAVAVCTAGVQVVASSERPQRVLRARSLAGSLFVRSRD